VKNAARRCFLVGLVFSLIVPPGLAGNDGCDAWDPECAPYHLAYRLSLPDDASKTRSYWRRNLVKRVGADQAFLMTSWWPTELREIRFALPLALSAVSAVQTGKNPDAWDRKMARSIERRTTGYLRDGAQFFTDLGQPGSALLLVGGTHAISRWADNERFERATSLSAEAMLNTAIYVGIAKRVMRRTRPSGGGTGEFFVSNPPAGQSNRSCPSGHAAGAFAVASVFAQEFGDIGWVPWAVYGTAGLIALSRVGLGRHFPTDILTGALLGDSMGRMVSHRSRAQTDGSDPS